MSRASADEPAKDGGRVVVKEILEIAILLVGANYVWRCGVGVLVFVRIWGSGFVVGCGLCWV